MTAAENDTENSLGDSSEQRDEKEIGWNCENSAGIA